MEYYSALKTKEILSQATVYMNLEDMMLSEISKSQKTNTVQFHLYEVPRIKVVETENGIVAARGGEGEKWEGEQVQSFLCYKMKKFWSSVVPKCACA